jgi:hypothetical protein
MVSKQIYMILFMGFIWLQNGFCSKITHSGSYNVNEVGLKIGYSTGSHFIAASKKVLQRKKYFMSINPNTNSSSVLY